MKTLRNQAFSPVLDPVGRNVATKTGSDVRNTNKINGFEHVSYGTALIEVHALLSVDLHEETIRIAKVRRRYFFKALRVSSARFGCASISVRTISTTTGWPSGMSDRCLADSAV